MVWCRTMQARPLIKLRLPNPRLLQNYSKAYSKPRKHSSVSFTTPTMTATTAPAITEAREAYSTLTTTVKEHSALSGISGLLGWDEMVMLPPNAANSRAAQKSALAGVLHEKSTDPLIGQLLQTIRQSPEFEAFTNEEKAVVRETAREYKKATAITKEVAQKEAELESKGYAAWVVARKNSNWADFAPVLKEWIELRKKRAALIDVSNPNPYDVLLDDYEKGMTSARLDEIFNAAKAEIVPLLASLRPKLDSPTSNDWLTEQEFDVDKQAELCEKIALALGFDLNSGRLDRSVHPFTGGAHPTDVRMTTRFKKNDITESLTGAIHETGHALYEQGRNLEYDGLPVNAALSMGVHESQSLLWERMVALSKPFSVYLLSLLKEYFPDQVPADCTPAQLYKALNTIKHPATPQGTFIRVEADECTYVLHIIIRYELEKGLIDGTIEVDDLPKAWNAKMKDYFGVVPETDAQGVLQDVHWSAGLFGYFPTYSLGAMMSSQIYETAEKEIPQLNEFIEQGDFKPLKEWLNLKVHRVGSLPESADELMTLVTGKPLDPEVFLRYIKTKYNELYS